MDKIAILLQKISSYNLYAFAEKVFGPYKRKHDGRQIVIIIKNDGSRRTVSYPKYLLEQHLGRELDPDEGTVDHKDYNIDNNNLSNLEIIPRKEHSRLDTRRVKLIKLKCITCGKKFERSPRLIRDKAKKGKRSQFCSRQCAGVYSKKVQMGLIDKLPASDYIESKYYRLKNELKKKKAFNERLINKYAKHLTWQDVLLLEEKKQLILDQMNAVKKKHKGSFGMPEEAKAEFIPLLMKYDAINDELEHYYNSQEDFIYAEDRDI